MDIEIQRLIQKSGFILFTSIDLLSWSIFNRGSVFCVLSISNYLFSYSSSFFNKGNSSKDIKQLKSYIDFGVNT